MSDQSAAELFEDDLVKIIMRRMSVRLQPAGWGSHIEVMLVDNKTGFAVRCAGDPLSVAVQITQPSLGVRVALNTDAPVYPTEVQ